MVLRTAIDPTGPSAGYTRHHVCEKRGACNLGGNRPKNVAMIFQVEQSDDGTWAAFRDGEILTSPTDRAAAILIAALAAKSVRASGGCSSLFLEGALVRLDDALEGRLDKLPVLARATSQAPRTITGP